mmetsp:Transcript_24485/g.53615  ORF Transcript_24485/g.53615 Transcript_24485/m.53615 type:complete len:251 (+) Transcript_24485:217-969(+)
MKAFVGILCLLTLMSLAVAVASQQYYDDYGEDVGGGEYYQEQDYGGEYYNEDNGGGGDSLYADYAKHQEDKAMGVKGGVSPLLKNAAVGAAGWFVGAKFHSRRAVKKIRKAIQQATTTAVRTVRPGRFRPADAERPAPGIHPADHRPAADGRIHPGRHQQRSQGLSVGIRTVQGRLPQEASGGRSQHVSQVRGFRSRSQRTGHPAGARRLLPKTGYDCVDGVTRSPYRRRNVTQYNCLLYYNNNNYYYYY